MSWSTEEIQSVVRGSPHRCAFIYSQHPDGTPSMNSKGVVQLMDGGQVSKSEGGTTSEVARFRWAEGFWVPGEPLDAQQSARCHALGREIIRRRLGV